MGPTTSTHSTLLSITNPSDRQTHTTLPTSPGMMHENTSNEPNIMTASEDHLPESTILQVIYSSPQGPSTFSKSLPATLPPTTTKERKSYLSRLRSSVSIIQEEVNQFLTTKMEEDKASVFHYATDVEVDDQEEDDYGEETAKG